MFWLWRRSSASAGFPDRSNALTVRFADSGSTYAPSTVRTVRSPDVAVRTPPYAPVFTSSGSRATLTCAVPWAGSVTDVASGWNIPFCAAPPSYDVASTASSRVTALSESLVYVTA
ncbi:hypothetical protein GCM10029978_106980 [Actinoallomurus acanthiterrae]